MAKHNLVQINGMANSNEDMDALQALMILGSSSFQQGQSPPYLLPMSHSTPASFCFPEQPLFATTHRFLLGGSVMTGSAADKCNILNNRNGFRVANDLLAFQQTLMGTRTASLDKPISVPVAPEPMKKKKTKKIKRKQEPNERPVATSNANFCREVSPMDDAVNTAKATNSSDTQENAESDCVMYTIEQDCDRPMEKVAVSRKRVHESSTEQTTRSPTNEQQQAKQLNSSMFRFPEPRSGTGDASSGFPIPTFDNTPSCVNNLDIEISGWLKLWNQVEDKVTTSILLRAGETSRTQATVQALFRESLRQERDTPPVLTKRSKK